MTNFSITDLPRNSAKGEKDQFSIAPFEKGLINFIQNSNTPITIALQGEWGSGKTSLMNSLKKELSDSENSTFHGIWLNTWEYALMKDAESTLLDIISKLVEAVFKIAQADDTKTQKLINRFWSGAKKSARILTKSALNKVVEGSGEIVDDLSSNGQSTIGEVRKDLENIIESCISKDHKKGFIFFIDDLDRIDPPVAVQLLELLKNIFTLKNCVFILAIDYDVVVKGLEPKFGKLSPQNEREFRSFFDKIIQVPFSMPVSNYRVDDFIKESLLSINYLNESHSENKKLISKFSDIADLSVGKNPRALKRLMNSLSLIGCINTAKGNTKDDDQLNEELELLVNFALVSIQIAYPPVYRLLTLYPGYDKWNESVALQMNLKSLDNQSVDKLNQSEEFDDEWEKVLFRLCENDHYLKKRALNISRLLNSLSASILEEEETIEDVVGAIISLSSVTNLEVFDKPAVDYNKSDFLKNIRNRLFPILSKKYPNNNIQQVGKRIVTNFNFSLIKDVYFHLSSYPKEGNVNLYIRTTVWYGNNIGDFTQDLKDHNLLADFESISNDYDAYFKTNNTILTHSLFKTDTWRHKKIDHCHINLHGDILLPNPTDFYTPESIEMISDYILKLKEFRSRVLEISNKRNNRI